MRGQFCPPSSRYILHPAPASAQSEQAGARFAVNGARRRQIRAAHSMPTSSSGHAAADPRSLASICGPRRQSLFPIPDEHRSVERSASHVQRSSADPVNLWTDWTGFLLSTVLRALRAPARAIRPISGNLSNLSTHRKPQSRSARPRTFAFISDLRQRSRARLGSFPSHSRAPPSPRQKPSAFRAVPCLPRPILSSFSTGARRRPNAACQ